MNINDAINIIDKIQGFSDDDSSCGEAWCAVKCYITAAPELLEALEAIIARERGEWDNPALLKFGPVADKSGDIIAIARVAILKTQGS